MSGKRMRNAKTFIVVTNRNAYAHRKDHAALTRFNAVRQRLRVGAKDEEHARRLVREHMGSGTSVNAIWEAPGDERRLPRGVVIDDIPYLMATSQRRTPNRREPPK